MCNGINLLSKKYSGNTEKTDRGSQSGPAHIRSCVVVNKHESVYKPKNGNDEVKGIPETSCIRTSKEKLPENNETFEPVQATGQEFECQDPPLEKGNSCCCCNTDPKPVERPKCPPPFSECERQRNKPNICDKLMKEANECKLKGCVTKCVKQHVKKVKRDQSHCETAIGMIPSNNPNDKTIFYPFSRLKDRAPIVCEQKKSSVQQLIEKKSAAVLEMTDNVGNFFYRAYNRAKEAIGMPAASSCGNQTSEKQPREQCRSRVCSSIRPKNTSCSVKPSSYDDESQTELSSNIKNLSTHSVHEFRHPVAVFYEKIRNTVETSYSSFGERSYFGNLLDIVTLPKPDRSSPYDVPTRPPTPPQVAILPPPTPPKIQSHHSEITPVHSGMMTSVKNTIRSIFRRNKSASSLPAEKKDKQGEDDVNDVEQENSSASDE